MRGKGAYSASPILIFSLLLILFFSLSGCASTPAPAGNSSAAVPQASGENLSAPHIILPDGARISLELAITPAQRTRGLSYRDSICGKCGMLFIFDNSAPRGFWMNAMQFPLDMLFIDENYTVVDVAQNLQPCGAECLLYHSKGKARYVLEVNAGFAAAHNLTSGLWLNLSGALPS